MVATIWDADTVYSLLRTALMFALVSWGLQELKKVWNWEPRWTWVVIVFGVALVGAMCAWRLTETLPLAPPEVIVWWCWWQAVAHFLAAGLPVAIWQEGADRIARIRAERRATVKE